MRTFYTLDGLSNPVPCDDVREWGRWLENADTTINRTELGPEGNVVVSTVFLGIDHDFSGQGKPILFETMVYILRPDGDADFLDVQYRYPDATAAQWGHESVVRYISEMLVGAGDVEALINLSGREGQL